MNHGISNPPPDPGSRAGSKVEDMIKMYQSLHHNCEEGTSRRMSGNVSKSGVYIEHSSLCSFGCISDNEVAFGKGPPGTLEFFGVDNSVHGRSCGVNDHLIGGVTG